MTELYLIEWVWDSNDTCPDNWSNLTENGVEAVCDSKESAAEYLHTLINRNLTELRKKYDEYKAEGYFQYTPFDSFLHDEGFVYKENNIPSKEDILKLIEDKERVLFEEDYTSLWYRCRRIEVYKGGPIDKYYKEEIYD